MIVPALLILAACEEAGPGFGSGSRTPDADTADSGGAETGGGDSGDSPTAASPWAPPEWDDQAWHFTAPDDRGLHWEIDDFTLDGFSVPQTCMLPSGRYGLMVTDMRAGSPTPGRYLFDSDDGERWDDVGIFLEPGDIPYDSTAHFEHSAMWRESVDTWTFIVDGAILSSGGDPAVERSFWTLSTSDLETWTAGPTAVFSGADGDDRVGVPTALGTSSGDAAIWYNGDLMDTSPAGTGTRSILLSPAEHAWTPLQPDPIYERAYSDPNAVHLEGGGVRIYSRFDLDDGPSGLAYANLDEDLAVIGEPAAVLESSGTCGKPPESGECLCDPSFLRTDDGTMYLYFCAITTTGDLVEAAVGRAIAVD